MDDHFDVAFKRLMELEGYESNDPDDPGGHTRFGISSVHHPEVDVSSLTLEGAKAIYREEYWIRPGFHLIRDRRLAVKLFTLGVLLSPQRSVRALQEACNNLGAGLMVDGRMGQRTAGWVNGYRHPAAIEALVETYATTYLISRGKRKYLAGWAMRVDA